MRQILTSSHLPDPVYRYSPVVKIGPLYQMAGMVGIDVDKKELVSGGVYPETKKILQNLQACLPDLQLTLSDMLSATIFTTHFYEFHHINRAWEEFFTVDLTPPARTSVGVSHLPMSAKVEIEFRFYKESDS